MGMPVNTILCGDCLEVMKDWPDNCVDLVLTDPPYGIDYESRIESKKGKIHGDDDLVWLNGSFEEIYRVLNKQGLMCSFYGFPMVHKFLKCWYDCGYRYKAHFVWVKNRMGLGQIARHKHEAAYLMAKEAPRMPPVAPPDVFAWQNTNNELHPTQKPVDALLAIIAIYSQIGDLILDPFCGSGTTCVAAKMLGRKYIGIDISEKYCEIARQRLEAVDTGVPVKEQRQGQKSLFK